MYEKHPGLERLKILGFGKDGGTKRVTIPLEEELTIFYQSTYYG